MLRSEDPSADPPISVRNWHKYPESSLVIQDSTSSDHTNDCKKAGGGGKTGITLRLGKSEPKRETLKKK